MQRQYLPLRMPSPLTQIIHILCQTQKLRALSFGESTQRPVSIVGICLERQVSSVSVEQPYQARIRPEGAHGSERGGFISPPESAGASEGWQAGGGGETGPTEGENAARGAEGGVERVDIVVGGHLYGSLSLGRGIR